MLHCVLERSAARFAFEIRALCFMPDHVHLLACGRGEDSDLRRFVTHFKQASGYAYARVHRGRLWAYSFYDHVVRIEESLEDIALYLLSNPVRAGLVERWEEYPHSACEALGKTLGQPNHRDGQKRHGSADE